MKRREKKSGERKGRSLTVALSPPSFPAVPDLSFCAGLPLCTMRTCVLKKPPHPFDKQTSKQKQQH